MSTAELSIYPARYTDRYGVESTTLRNNGARLYLRLRGVTFSGADFDSLEPDPHAAPEALATFDLHGGALCNCTIECEIPLPVVQESRTIASPLEVHLELGRPTATGCLDREVLILSLRLEGQSFRSAGDSGWFEDELLTLQSSLPAGSYLKACIGCAHADYSPYGHGLFGGIACFRNWKEEHSRVKDKFDLFAILDKAELVQETYLCPEFERRRPNSGYRG